MNDLFELKEFLFYSGRIYLEFMNIVYTLSSIASIRTENETTP